MKMLKISAAIIAIVFGAAVSAQAVARTWIGNTDTNLANGANWDTPFSVGDTMMFGVSGSSGTNLYNNLGAGISVSGITFNADSPGYVINGNAITLDGIVSNLTTWPQVINLDMTLTTNWNIVCASNNITLGGVISGSGGLIKGRSRDLTLLGTNTYTGQTRLNNGKLIVTSLNSVNGGTPLFAGSSLGAPTTVANGTITLGSLASTGILVYAGSGETSDRIVDLVGTSGVVMIDQEGTGLLKFTSNFSASGAGSKTLFLLGSTAGTGEIAGAIVDNSAVNITSLAKNGAGTWTLSGSNTYSGSTVINNGTLQFGNGGTGRSLPFGAVTNNGVLVINQGNATSVLSSISGSGDLIKAGNGTLFLAGSNTCSGKTIVSSGILNVGSVAGIPVSILDPGFEVPVTNGYQPSGALWTFGAGTGIAPKGTWFSVDAPEGTQAGFIQGDSRTFSQTITISTAAMYEVSFQAIGRGGVYGPDGLILKADGMQFASWTNGDFSQTSWGTYTGRVFLLEGPHTLTFMGWNTLVEIDKSIAIDAVSIVSAPMSQDVLSTNSTLYLASGAWLDLSSDTQTVSMLYLDGHLAYPGTHGGTGSGARYINTNHFLGTGVLNVKYGSISGTVVYIR